MSGSITQTALQMVMVQIPVFTKYFIEQQGCVLSCDGGQWVAGHETIGLFQSMGGCHC